MSATRDETERRGISRRQLFTWGAGAATGLFLTSKFGVVKVLTEGAGRGGDSRGNAGDGRHPEVPRRRC
jgi:hypothetical protein